MEVIPSHRKQAETSSRDETSLSAAQGPVLQASTGHGMGRWDPRKEATRSHCRQYLALANRPREALEPALLLAGVGGALRPTARGLESLPQSAQGLSVWNHLLPVAEDCVQEEDPIQALPQVASGGNPKSGPGAREGDLQWPLSGPGCAASSLNSAHHQFIASPQGETRGPQPASPSPTCNIATGASQSSPLEPDSPQTAPATHLCPLLSSPWEGVSSAQKVRGWVAAIPSACPQRHLDRAGQELGVVGTQTLAQLPARTTHSRALSCRTGVPFARTHQPLASTGLMPPSSFGSSGGRELEGQTPTLSSALVGS